MAAVFLLPMWMTGSLIALGGFALLRLASRTDRNSWWISLKKPGVHWIVPLFFMMHLAGMLWSSNLKFGFRDLETKLSLLLLPALLFAVDTRKSWTFIRSAFIGGCLIAGGYLLINAFINYLEQGRGLSFFYIEFSSPLMHPTYLSMLINLALLLLIQRLADSPKQENSSIILWGSMLFFWMMLDLLSARMPFLVTLLTCSGYLLWQTLRKSMNRSVALKATLCMLTGFAGMVWASSYTGRVNEVSQAINTTSLPETSYNSTTGRLEIWKQGIELLPEVLPWGAGTGDVKDILLDSYRAHEFAYGLDRSLNAHNQYLQTTLALGIPGLICLLLIIAIPFFDRKSNHDPVFIWFIVIVGLNATVESILEVQRGVLMIALFIPLLMSLGRPKVAVEGMP